MDILFVILGFVLLYFGGEFLVKGAAGLSLKLGISALIVSLTIVAFGTSAPELAVSIYSAQKGQTGVALGNVIGSNIANVCLILGVTGLILPITVNKQLIRFDIPFMLVCSLLLYFLVWDKNISHVEAGGLCAVLIGYILFSIYKARHDKKAVKKAQADADALKNASESEADEEDIDEELKAEKSSSYGKLAVYLLGGIVTVIFGGKFFVDGAIGIASALGVSKEIIALSVVALGTSLPELATSITAARHGHSDIALGNVVGSNIMNICCILGTTGLIKELPLQGIRDIDLYVMLGSSLLLLPLAAHKLKLTRAKATVFIMLYLGYNAQLFLQA